MQEDYYLTTWLTLERMTDFKETDIGQIPSHWNLLTVDEIKSPTKKSIISGPFGSNISAKYFVESGVPVIRGNNLSLDIQIKFKDEGFVFITDEKANELGTWAEKYDIIFTAVGTIGQVGILVDNEKYSKYIISNKQLRLRVNTDLVEPLYAYYWFASPFMIDMILQRNTGSSVPLINLSVLKSLLIPLPPKEERISILKIISSLDDKIDLLHRQNATLEKMAETLFRQWFVEEAKEEWEEKKLGEFFPVITGKKDANYAIEDGKYPFFTCSQKTLLAPSYSFDGKAILLAGNGDFNVKRYKGKFEAYQRTYVLIPYDEKYHDFLYVLMKFFLTQITEGHQGSVINFLTKGMITDFKVLLPIQYDDKLTEFEKIYKKVDINTNQIRTLTALRDTLLPKLMSGEVKVEI